jgi:hypothetical protein
MTMNRIAAMAALVTCLGCSPPEDGIDDVHQNLAPVNGGGGTSDSASDAAKAQAEANRKREAYLNTKYPRERGQSFDQKQTLFAAIRDVWVTAQADKFPPNDDVPGPFTSEYISGLYQGKYGDNYYFAPKKGEWDVEGGFWRTVTHQEDWPPRPEQRGVWGSVHNHTRGHGPESPIDANGLNLTPVWVVTDDGKIWVYPPKSGTAKSFGTMDGKGNIITAYNTLEDAVNPNYDVYAVMESGGGSCGFWCWTAVILGISSGGAAATGAVIGSASSTGSGCCYGPPTGGYPPGSDPTQICRRPNGDDCS